MNEKNQRLLEALGDVDEKFVEESAQKEKRGMKGIIAASVAVVIALSLALYLFVPCGVPTSDLSAYKGSGYFEIINRLESQRLSSLSSEYDNNFEKLVASIDDFLNIGGSNPSISVEDGLIINGSSSSMDDSAEHDYVDVAPPPGDTPTDVGSSEGNGSYVEVTDNQVAGVVEADLFKMTDKYIFRIDREGMILNIYSIDKENSACVNSVNLLELADSTISGGYEDAEIYLSKDSGTLMLMMTSSINYERCYEMFSFDVSDVHNVLFNGKISIQGRFKTSRMVDGKLILATDYYFDRDSVDYNDPSTFVPGIDTGDGFCPIDGDDLVVPKKASSTRYTVLTVVDMNDLAIVDTMAVYGYSDDVYFSRDSIYIITESSWMNKVPYDSEGNNSLDFSDTTDIKMIDYSGDTLEYEGEVSVNGTLNNQYSLDERDGYLRVVTSTFNVHVEKKEQTFKQNKNVSLYIFDLSDNTLAYSVEDFAIEGEEATSVRFDGDALYVCTAEVVTFTDPVYFFDLSDYENITYTDTGVIDGFSDSLINLGEGFLLGIGSESWQYNKVEVYEERDGGVASVDKFLFCGEYSDEYKSYLVNREYNFFGFAVWGYIPEDYEMDYPDGDLIYLLTHFDGYELVVSEFVIEEKCVDIDEVNYIRAAFIDGYLYITTPESLIVEKIANN